MENFNLCSDQIEDYSKLPFYHPIYLHVRVLQPLFLQAIKKKKKKKEKDEKRRENFGIRRVNVYLIKTYVTNVANLHRLIIPTRRVRLFNTLLIDFKISLNEKAPDATLMSKTFQK